MSSCTEPRGKRRSRLGRTPLPRRRAAEGFDRAAVGYGLHLRCTVGTVFVYGTLPAILLSALSACVPLSPLTTCALRAFHVMTACLLRAYCVLTACLLRACYVLTACVRRACYVLTPVLRAYRLVLVEILLIAIVVHAVEERLGARGGCLGVWGAGVAA